MLRTALGPSIAAWLDDPAVIEVMLNPDGRLWVDRLGEGISDTGETLSAADGERIVRLVAHHVGVEVHAAPRASRPSCPKGASGSRAAAARRRGAGLRHPQARRRGVHARRLCGAGIMSAAEAAAAPWRRARANILVAGGTGAARPRWSMRCWPKSPRPPIASS
jgi:type IV secretion system protein VirB11